MSINVAIIGCSKIAHLHAKALLQIPILNFKAVWSRTPDSARKFADTYQVKAYASIEEMIKEDHIQMAIICTAHPYHADPAVEAMEAGAHVLIEKPLASTLQDCDRITEASRRTGRIGGIISQRRWYQPVQRLKKAINEGKIGTPALGIVQMMGWRDRSYYESDAWRGSWKMEGGGVLVNQAPHSLDILQWLMGDIDEVFGYWTNVNHPYIEVEDTALALIRFKNGGIGNILVSNSQKPGLYSKVHVHGSNGASVGAQTEGGSMFLPGNTGIQDAPRLDLWTVPGEEHLMEQWNKADAEAFHSVDSMTWYFKQQLEDFAEAVIHYRPPLVTLEEGRKTVELFTAIYRSQRDGKPVKFPLQPEGDRDDMDGRLTMAD
ncbi:MAG TPA: Gfo/Idh/MocA family oxidoreductase [Prolixibacteraceae bacterium]|nr:Gfo/Idh/MocA family oxidoreductase [Prolixibacteraceae bacterium]